MVGACENGKLGAGSRVLRYGAVDDDLAVPFVRHWRDLAIS
jgi:hypothetical protein